MANKVKFSKHLEKVLLWCISDIIRFSYINLQNTSSVASHSGWWGGGGDILSLELPWNAMCVSSRENLQLHPHNFLTEHKEQLSNGGYSLQIASAYKSHFRAIPKAIVSKHWSVVQGIRISWQTYCWFWLHTIKVKSLKYEAWVFILLTKTSKSKWFSWAGHIWESLIKMG